MTAEPMSITLEISRRGPVRVVPEDEGLLHLRLGADVFDSMAEDTPDAAEQLRAVASVLRSTGGEVESRLAPEGLPFKLKADIRTEPQ